uniref:Uncharacterized protein n=1 Tax=Anguilla anguilla TaxID=7936 RepID=A0A0E9UKK0_ANGAN
MNEYSMFTVKLCMSELWGVRNSGGRYWSRVTPLLLCVSCQLHRSLYVLKV